MTAVLPFASRVDAFAYGEYRAPARPGARFRDRVTADGLDGPRAEADRYHLYARWSCPASHRLAILRVLAGLEDVVSISYVDGLRDARGWAFREATGPDPVNGFTLLREAYESTHPGYDGEVRVPLLWDRDSQRIVSDEPIGLGVDLATAFRAIAPGAAEVYPAAYAGQIERLGEQVAREIDSTMALAVYRPHVANALGASLRALDSVLGGRPRLVGSRLTDADVRLWVSLVRFDAGPNAHGAIGARLDSYRNLWRWARDLYALPAFRDTTDFAAFAAPLADLPPWD